MNIDDVISIGTSLSTAADSLSQHCDLLIGAAEKAISAITGGGLPLNAQQQAAIQSWKDITVSTGAHRDNVDAEVAKLDAALPSPAPIGSPEPPTPAAPVEPPPIWPTAPPAE